MADACDQARRGGRAGSTGRRQLAALGLAVAVVLSNGSQVLAEDHEDVVSGSGADCGTIWNNQDSYIIDSGAIPDRDPSDPYDPDFVYLWVTFSRGGDGISEIAFSSDYDSIQRTYSPPIHGASAGIATRERAVPAGETTLTLDGDEFVLPYDALTCSGSFDDVPVDHAFFEEIEWLASEGVTDGYPDRTFRPGTEVTRQAIAAFFHRYAGEPAFTPPAEPTFSDVPSDHPFFAEIEWLADSGVTSGYDDGTFRPGAEVTRQAAAAFFHRHAGEPASTSTTATFDDVEEEHAFFAEIEWLASTAVTQGYPDGTFRPGVDVTRQAAAAFFDRYDELE